MYAAYMGQENTINLLLDCGADPNSRTRQGSTSLILAAMCGNFTVMPLLLQVDFESFELMFLSSSSTPLSRLNL